MIQIRKMCSIIFSMINRILIIFKNNADREVFTTLNLEVSRTFGISGITHLDAFQLSNSDKHSQSLSLWKSPWCTINAPWEASNGSSFLERWPLKGSLKILSAFGARLVRLSTVNGHRVKDERSTFLLTCRTPPFMMGLITHLYMKFKGLFYGY